MALVIWRSARTERNGSSCRRKTSNFRTSGLESAPALPAADAPSPLRLISFALRNRLDRLHQLLHPLHIHGVRGDAVALDIGADDEAIGVRRKMRNGFGRHAAAEE